MPEKDAKPAGFGEIWTAALVEFYASTKHSLDHETQLLNLQSTDQLIEYLTRERAECNVESARCKA